VGLPLCGRQLRPGRRPEGDAAPVDNVVDGQDGYLAIGLEADASYRDRAEKAQAIF
jgi:hypothetical protein